MHDSRKHNSVRVPQSVFLVFKAATYCSVSCVTIVSGMWSSFALSSSFSAASAASYAARKASRRSETEGGLATSAGAGSESRNVAMDGHHMES